jgi:hypothetical protein
VGCWVGCFLLGYLKLRNRACFEHKLVKNPFKLISYSIVFRKHWAGLHEGKDAETFVQADSLLRLAGASATPEGNSATTDGCRPLRLMDVDRGEEDARGVEEDDQDDAIA